jgi:hypothetical protein
MSKIQLFQWSAHGQRIEMVIGDHADPLSATTWIRFSVPLALERARPVADAQLEALQLAQSALDEEIQSLKSLAARNP